MKPAPLSRLSSQIFSARISLRDGDRYALKVDDEQTPRATEELMAQRAASCLLVPEPGDRVVVALAPEPWVIAIIERAGDRPSELKLQGPARIAVSHGALHIESPEAVKVESGGRIDLEARQLATRSERMDIVTDHLGAIARRAKGTFAEISLVSKACELVAERVVQRADRVYRFISEIDQLRAQHVDHRAAGSLQLKGEHTAITARQVMRVDGEQVHIG